MDRIGADGLGCKEEFQRIGFADKVVHRQPAVFLAVGDVNEVESVSGSCYFARNKSFKGVYPLKVGRSLYKFAFLQDRIGE